MTEIIASPSVRVLALNLGIDLQALGREIGRTTLGREDVLAKARGGIITGNATRGPASPSPWDVDHGEYGEVSPEPMTSFARVAAANLAASCRQIPSVTHHDRADVETMEGFRSSLKSRAEARGIRLTGMAFHVKVLARALIEYPRFNASLSRDGKTLFLKNYVHVGFAVACDHGLAVPVIRNVDRKGLWEVASEIACLSTRARERRLLTSETGGGSMTITNLGSIGGRSFTPIINPPEVAILGISRTEHVPVWNGSAFTGRPMVPLSMTYDHRVIDGANAARFTTYYAQLISDPRRIML